MDVSNDRTKDVTDPRNQPIRSFHARHGRARPLQIRTLESLWPLYGVNFPDDHQEPGLARSLELDGSADRFVLLRGLQTGVPSATQMGLGTSIILDVGFGMGDATVAMAMAEPESTVLAIDVHRPGVVRLLSLIDELSLTNVRVARGDVHALLAFGVPERSLAGVRVFFPDPWPKARHQKRRLIQPVFAAQLACRIEAGGFVHLATDWMDYAEHMREVFAADDRFEEVPTTHTSVNATRPDSHVTATRPETPYERAGIDNGHTVTDLRYRRR